MKKINEGKLEIFTTMQDAIDKFIELEGICRQDISGDNATYFYCSKKGRITISNPPRRSVSDNSTKLHGQIFEENGKTYVSYHTDFDKQNNVTKLVMTLIYVVFGIYCLINIHKPMYSLLMVICIAGFVYDVITILKEKRNSADDSKILVKELENKVDAVNRWDEF